MTCLTFFASWNPRELLLILRHHLLWPFDDVITGLKSKFISKTFNRDVEFKFNTIGQVADGHLRLSVDELADKLRDLARQMIKCTTKQLKQRLIDALERRIAAEVNKELQYDDPRVSFEDIRDKAVRIETGLLAAKAAAILHKNGQSLPNSPALSATAALQIFKEDDAKSRKGNKNGNAQGGKPQSTQPERRQLANIEPKRQARPQGKGGSGGGNQKRDPPVCWNCGDGGCRSYKCPKPKAGDKGPTKSASAIELEPVEENAGDRLLYAYETLSPELNEEQEVEMMSALQRV